VHHIYCICAQRTPSNVHSVHAMLLLAVVGVFTQRFANEDHLSVHQAKHEMSLSLTSGATRAGIVTFVGQ